MKNVRIERTGNDTFVVRFDTVRFGRNAIMFESFRRDDCVRYIMRAAAMIIKFSDSFEAREDAYEAIIHFLPVEKKRQIVNACGRNAYFTSAWTLEWTEVDFFMEGMYLTFRGVQTSVNVWISAGGSVGRKPAKKRIIREREHVSFHNWEGSFKFMIDDVEEGE